MRRVLSVIAGLLIAGLAWEGYKAVGNPEGTVLFGVRVLPRADDLSMPHLATIADRLGAPELAGGRPVWQVVLDACVFTLGITAAGFVAGALIGLVLAVAMQRFRIVERGLLPYVILSQTVPLVALAPLIAGWGGVVMPPWATVAVIAAYLAFFPVAVGMLRGLQSPSASGVELMRSYAAGWWRTLVKLRFPAALPYLFPALRLAGAAAVVGAVVGEISTGTRGGIGRLIIEYSREATSDPAKVYTAMLGAALLGLLVAAAVSLLEVPLMRHRRHVEVVTL
ncbi:NitT/TauT family transport system permease protein [Actinoplanes lutulentus]|uniref:NitT/TauT family transport system permease protein n=1 Tax=Actinoplanes lutulentus TaxID=1287878 RepID=A0A327ZK51_9ACTN|nr:ABC transporter permease subunit [Actinoplanes lutulentus]MBB2944136.1 NitT/TauT family transport system permease protein [Actinoplanes lutulentus]RAK42631.1 NitT/TauT family transport system permease protein [Actinoplanes lutulentus]